MGLFSKKNKTYSLQEALKLVQTDKYSGYMAVPTGENSGQFWLVKEDIALEEARNIRQRENSRRNEFANQLSGNGSYRNIGIPNYNNYGQAKRYNPKEYMGR